MAAALAKAPEHRPTARQLLDQLTGSMAAGPGPGLTHPDDPGADLDAGQPAAWPAARGLQGAGARRTEGSLLLDQAPRPAGTPVAGIPPTKKRRLTRRVSGLAAAALGAAALAAAVIIVVLHGHTPAASPAANQGSAGTAQPAAANALPTYPGQLTRGVFQTIDRIVASGNTIVTTGSQESDGAVRQQFFVSADAGRTWRLAPVQLPGGGQPPLGYPAERIAGGPRGWMAEGDHAIWTSPDGQSWTLAGRHGITPRQAGDVVNVVSSTPDGFLAAGYDGAGASQQAVIWTSRNGVTWQRLTAAQLGLQEPSGGTPPGIDFATSQGSATLIADRGSGVWLSTDSGAHWSAVTIPVDHGAQASISGASFDKAGLILVRPGTAASGAGDGVAYFSADGRTWRYAGTIDAAGGWSPDAVKGSDYGFVVTGHTQGQYVAYTSTGTGARWLPTAPLGDTSNGPGFNPALGADGSVIAAGNTNSTRTGQEGLLIKADTAGNITPVSLSAIPGGLIPEEKVRSTAKVGNVQIAVGSANGYPAVWRRVSGGPWSLVSTLAQVSADADLNGLSTVTHGPHGWVATGPGGFTLTSADGTNWTRSQG